MNKLFAAIAILVISAASPGALAENYLPGEPLPRSATVLERLRDAFLPGFRQQSDYRYGNAFVKSPTSRYVFADEIARRGDNLSRTPGVISSDQEVPIGNVFNFSF